MKCGLRLPIVASRPRRWAPCCLTMCCPYYTLRHRTELRTEPSIERSIEPMRHLAVPGQPRGRRSPRDARRDVRRARCNRMLRRRLSLSRCHRDRVIVRSQAVCRDPWPMSRPFRFPIVPRRLALDLDCCGRCCSVFCGCCSRGWLRCWWCGCCQNVSQNVRWNIRVRCSCMR